MVDKTLVDNVHGLETTQSSKGIAGKIFKNKQKTVVKEEILTQRQFLDRLSSTLFNGLYIFNFQKREINFINRQYTNLTGYTLKDIRQLTKENTFSNFFHPDDRKMVAAYIHSMSNLKDGEIREITYRFRRKDGQWVWLLSRETLYSRNPDGSVCEYMGSFLDITSQKLAEEKFKNLADSMPQLVWTADPDGSVDYYNNKYRELIGIKVRKGKYQWTPALHPDDVVKTKKTWDAAIKHGTIYEIEQRVKVKDNGYEWFLSRSIPIKDSQGKIIKWYGTSTNIHKVKQLEQQKDEFIAVASHELRTPVTTIKAYGQFLQTFFKRSGNKESQGYIQKINTQIDRLTLLISDLLDVTKIQAGQLQLKKAEFDFNHLILEVVEEMQLTTGTQKIHAKLDHTIVFCGDRERISQVLMNLISNAIKFSPPTQEVIISSKINGGNIIVCVQDFGIGISKDKQAKIFERFYQADDQTTNRHGLGIGLYISKQIIKRHEGKIWFESQKNQGSSFYFSLPIK